MDVSAVHDGLVGRLRDFCQRTRSSGVTLGLSGGIDSALVTYLAVEALGAGSVHPLFLPSPFTSEQSLVDSEQLCKNLGVRLHVHPIGGLYERFSEESLTLLRGMGELGDIGDEGGLRVMQDNLQARIRGVLLMALSNYAGLLVLNTTNRSECYVGYTTLYGDACGAVSVLGSLYKSEVYALADYVNDRGACSVIPQPIIDRAPSAELHEGQLDSDSLPEYPVLDRILRVIVDRVGCGGASEAEREAHYEQARDGLIGEYGRAVVERVEGLVLSSEFKRGQLPPVL